MVDRRKFLSYSGAILLAPIVKLPKKSSSINEIHNEIKQTIKNCVGYKYCNINNRDSLLATYLNDPINRLIIETTCIEQVKYVDNSKHILVDQKNYLPLHRSDITSAIDMKMRYFKYPRLDVIYKAMELLAVDLIKKLQIKQPKYISSFNLYHDPCMYKCRRVGWYGWYEIWS